MGEEIVLENGRISDFHGLVNLTLTSDRVTLHTIMHHSSTSAYTPDFIKIKETFCGRTDGRTFETHLLGRLGGVHLKTRIGFVQLHITGFTSRNLLCNRPFSIHKLQR